jgi:LPS O-antigen subunit length determinant protein (WzzB/FepE family)
MATYPDTEVVQNEPIAYKETGDLSQRETKVSLLDILVLLAGKKRFIVRFVLCAAVLATVVSFLLQNRYEAKIVLMPPSQSSSAGSALLGHVPFVSN